jgi:hypothetical protein
MQFSGVAIAGLNPSAMTISRVLVANGFQSPHLRVDEENALHSLPQ